MLNSLILSPSGNFYGSEQVLFDYVSSTRIQYKIFVQGKKAFYNKLLSAGIAAHTFKSVTVLYARIFFLCLAGRCKSVYLNEAGHSKYVQLLASIFKKINFVIHVRIIEDTSDARWNKKLPANLTIISISEFIASRLPVKNTLIYDPYPFSDAGKRVKKAKTDIFRIAIIGRVSVSKGIDYIIELLKVIKTNKLQDNCSFHFFGDITEEVKSSERISTLNEFTNVFFEGFVNDKDSIYNNVDCVLHGAGNEPLGRIFLEAIDYNIPFIGINNGGISEIAMLTGLDEMVVPYDSKNIGYLFFEKIQNVKNNYESAEAKMIIARQKAKQTFSLSNYVNRVDSLLN